MPILSAVESRSVAGRVTHLVIIVLLALGGVTMIVPFAVMVSGSFRSEMDEADLDLLPAFWRDDAALYAKFLETKYNQDIASLNRGNLHTHIQFAAVDPPDTADGAIALVDELEAWMRRAELPAHWQELGGTIGVRTVPPNLRRLRQRLKHRFGGDLDAFGRNLGAPVTSWGSVVIPPPAWTDRRYDHADDALHDEYLRLMRDRPVAERQLVSISGAFLEKMIYPLDGQNTTEGYNRRHAPQTLASYQEFRLPQTVPGEDQPTLRREWIEFVRQELNPSFIIVAEEHAAEFRDMLAATYPGGALELNQAWRTSYSSHSEVSLPRGEWLSGQRRHDYITFLAAQPPERLTLIGPEYAWADHLRTLGRLGDPALRPLPPIPQLEWRYALENARRLRWDFTTRNYVIVWDELVTQGDTLVNTLIFVLLAISLSLLVNPLAAYALSRYQLPGTYKIQLFLMATMAFPPMVTLIPQFIVLDKLDLLNTFAALVLPLIVNGYMIFLLKGFFDSLPRELYEAARIDGAGEVRMFVGITMALSKPILAVLALGTFTSAYMAFLYPLLAAPDPDMWLISVWLFQFQQRSSTAAVFASVVVASIPTLIVFLFVQRTILRGIVVPTEK